MKTYIISNRCQQLQINENAWKTTSHLEHLGHRAK